MVFVEILWKAGANISSKEIKAWMQPFAGKDVDESIVELLAKIRERTGRDWAALVVLNQAYYTEDPAGTIRTLADAPGDPLTYIAKWRAEGIDLKIVINRPIEPAKYIENVDSPVEFFRTVYAFENNVDFEKIDGAVKEIVENERLAPSVYRLVDIDAPFPPDAFVERVETALKILTDAKNEGINPEKIISLWDELADEGGERFEKLAAAVKRVAEEAVKERFWDEMRSRFEENGVRIYVDALPKDLVGTLYYLELIQIDGQNVDLGPMEETITNVARLLKKARVVPMYKATELEKILEKMGVNKASDGSEIEYVASVLAELERMAARAFVESEVASAVVDIILRAKREGIPEEDVVSAVSPALKEVYAGNITSEEELEQYVEKRLFS